MYFLIVRGYAQPGIPNHIRLFFLGTSKRLQTLPRLPTTLVGFFLGQGSVCRRSHAFPTSFFLGTRKSQQTLPRIPNHSRWVFLGTSKRLQTLPRLPTTLVGVFLGQGSVCRRSHAFPTTFDFFSWGNEESADTPTHSQPLSLGFSWDKEESADTPTHSQPHSMFFSWDKDYDRAQPYYDRARAVSQCTVGQSPSPSSATGESCSTWIS